ncbi:hypothetical protein AGMMS4957_05280 [Bacteroidia bacterium]|nr:hypothetical protein AGMMS4957_05280 [Bacteroidia bacterium]
MNGSRIYRLLFTLLIACTTLTGWGQGASYPVQVMTQLTPPYSLILSDYAKPASQRLFVTIMVRDLNIVNLPVRLHIKMETLSGMTVETVPNIITPAIYLTGGLVTMLYGTDLTDYFNINNLQFKGYSKEDYRRTGQLPEGHYRITVEVRHWATGRIISSQGTAYTWMALGKPPVLKVPEDKAEMGKIPGMPLTFSWIPNKVGIPGVIPQYKFEMWEMRIPGINPNVIAASLPPFYTTTQLITNLVIHPATLNFEPGLEYAWRVTAFDPIGDVSFEQGGHSVIRTFTYQCKCEGVSDVKLERKGQNVAVSWNQIPNTHTSFHLEMENQASGWSATDVVYYNKANSGQLVVGATYRMRVRAICDGNTMNPSEPTAWQTITIPEPPKRDNSKCGTPVKSIPVTNYTLRTDLQAGDFLTHPKSGGSRYTIKTATPQGDGKFKGIFVSWWGWAGDLKIPCEYWDLSVNTDNQILTMKYHSISKAAFLLDVDAAKAKIENVTDAVTNLANTAADAVNTLVESIKPNNATPVDFAMPENPVADISKPGEVTITDEKGENLQIVELPKNEDGSTNLPAMIQDASGKTFIVDKNGNVAQDNNTSTTSTTSADTNSTSSDSTSSDSTSTKSKAHYSIEGHDFYDGETIYLPLSDKPYEIKAYRDSVNLFGEGAVWSSGVNKVDAATVRFTPNTVSRDINGTGISTVLGNDALRCKIVVVNAEFGEDNKQKQGFDENDKDKENDYPSFQTTPVAGLPWKSLQVNGMPDIVRVKVLPIGAEKAVKFVSSNSSVQVASFVPETNNNIWHTLSISATSIGESELIPQIGHFSAEAVQLKIRGLSNQPPKTLAIVTIHSTNHQSTDISAMMTLDELKDYLNKTAYNQANIEWDVTQLPADSINYDIDGDGKIDVQGDFPSNEVQIIINKYRYAAYNYILFIVDNPNKNIFGKMGMNQKFGVIHVDRHTSKHQLQNTIAHELGHGAFELKHPFQDATMPSYNRGKDTNNFMDYYDGDKIRKYQWDIINP